MPHPSSKTKRKLQKKEGQWPQSSSRRGHAGAKEGPAPTPAGSPGQLCLQLSSKTSTSCLSFPSGPWMSKHPISGVFHAHKSGVSKHDHRHIATGTELCYWH